MPNGTRSQVLGAFRFLGLIDDEGWTQPELKEMVEAKESRKEVFRNLIERSYTRVLALDLTKTSPLQLAEAIRDNYNVQGATLEKAVSFLMAAVQYAEIPVSQLLLKKRAQLSQRRTKKQVKAKEGAAPREGSNKPELQVSTSSTPANSSSGGTTKTIDLKSGGSLALMISVDVFKLDSSDREFVFGLVDKLNEYGKVKIPS